MRRTRSILLLATAISMLASLTTTAVAAPPELDRQAQHQRVIDFWTHERVAKAIPRDFVFDRAGGFVPAKKPSNPGKPGGGGDGGDTSLVTGASWTSGGRVLGTTGKVLFRMGGSYYVCSASVVADNSTSDDDAVILTAAHCAYDETNGAFADMWMFVPAYDSAPAPLTASGSFCADTVYGCWTASALTVHSGYANAGGFNDTAVQYDFAFATVYRGGKDANTVLDALVGTHGISYNSVSSGVEVYSFGYPAAQKYKGDDLVYCRGPVQNPPPNGDPTYRIECGMTGGSSGGPWFASFVNDPTNGSHGTGTLVSVNSYGYRGDSGMYGPMFNGDTQTLHTAADGASTNQIKP
ncbi:MAG: hypothetical protein R3246_11205 [Acidimicrobiia bacterium]|nr:hypothetical protein [Acidimicrobiia bacterium]